MKQFRGGLVFKAHRLVYHSTVGSRVMMQEKKKDLGHRNFEAVEEGAAPHDSTRVERDVVKRRQVLRQL